MGDEDEQDGAVPSALDVEPPPKRRKKANKRAVISPSLTSVWSTRKVLYACAWIVALAFLLYGRTIRFDYTAADDVTLIRDDTSFLSSDGAVWSAFSRSFFGNAQGKGEPYYRPLVAISFIFDWKTGGGELTSFHFTNVLLHAIASVLLFAVLRRMRVGDAMALVGASLFVVHPALTEAVAWIPGRCDSLVAIFAFGSLLSWQKYLEEESPRSPFAHALLFFLALLTKEAAIVLPAVCLAYAFLVAEKPAAAKDKRAYICWGFGVAAWAVLRTSALGASGTGTRAVDKAQAVFAQLPALFMYLGKVVFPTKLAVLAVTTDTPWLPGAVAAVIAIVVAVRLRGRERRLFLFGLFVFLLFIAPTLAVSDYLILENRLYVPCAGILIAAIAAVGGLLKARPTWSGAVKTCAVAVALGLLWSSNSYADTFANSHVFTRAAVDTSPHSALAHLFYGSDLIREGHLAEAEPILRRALELRPNEAVVHNNLGFIYLRRNEYARAEVEFRKELEINPNYEAALTNLALVLRRQGKTEAAEQVAAQAKQVNPKAELAVEVSPDNVPFEVLQKAYENSLASDPTNREARREYARSCLKRKHPCAKEQFGIILQMNPNDEEARRAMKGL